MSQAEAYIGPHCGTIPLLDVKPQKFVEEGTSKRRRGTTNSYGKRFFNCANQWGKAKIQCKKTYLHIIKNR